MVTLLDVYMTDSISPWSSGTDTSSTDQPKHSIESDRDTLKTRTNIFNYDLKLYIIPFCMKNVKSYNDK